MDHRRLFRADPDVLNAEMLVNSFDQITYPQKVKIGSSMQLQIHTEDGRVHHAESPGDLTTGEFLNEFLVATGTALRDDHGHLIAWKLFDKSTGRTLESNKTLQQNGLHADHDLYLNSREPTPPPNQVWRCSRCHFQNWVGGKFCAQCGTPLERSGSDLQLVVQDPKGRILTKKVAGNTSTRHFLKDLLVELGLPNRDMRGVRLVWNIDDKDIPKTLLPNKTLSENGVLDGHHLFLRGDAHPPLPWAKIVTAVAVLALCCAIGLGAFGAYRYIQRARISVSIEPSGNINLAQSESRQFSAIVGGSGNPAVRWSTDPLVGSITQDGKYGAPESITQTQNIVITAASVANPNKSARVVVTLVAPQDVRPPLNSSGGSAAVSQDVRPSVNPSGGAGVNQKEGTSETQITSLSISPRIAHLGENGKIQFRVRVDPPNQQLSIQWSLSKTLGQISQDGIYTAPQLISRREPIFVKAAIVGVSSHSATARIVLEPTIVSPVTNPVNPTPPHTGRTVEPVSFRDRPDVTLTNSQTHTFSVTGKDIRWSISGPGQIDQQGRYVAPPKILVAQSVSVTAASTTDPTFATTVVTLKPYDGPLRGSLTWSGMLAKDEVLTIDEHGASAGSVQGTLPGVPVVIEPLGNDLVLLESPSLNNDWKRIRVQSRKEKRAFKIMWSTQ